MKYLVTLNVAKNETLIHVNRPGQSYIVIKNGQNIELSEKEFALAVAGCAGAVSFSPVFEPKAEPKVAAAEVQEAPKFYKGARK